MGQFIYGGIVTQRYDLDDRLLAHLQVAITAKLRRGEPFPFTLTGRDLPTLSGHRVFWMHPTVGVQFHFDADRNAIPLNPSWVRTLIMAASSDGGLRITAEPHEDEERDDAYPPHEGSDKP